jgi:hypothetical protein
MRWYGKAGPRGSGIGWRILRSSTPYLGESTPGKDPYRLYGATTGPTAPMVNAIVTAGSGY